VDPANPYAAPTASAEPHDPRDSVDLYRATLPTPVVHTTGIAALISGIAMIVIDARLLAAVVEANVALLVLLGAIAFAGLGYLAVAWGVREGRLWSLFLGFAACVVGGLASIVVLLTGLLAGLLGGTLALFTTVMLATSVRPVRAMAQARAALARLERAERATADARGA
jgi:hypothetical protein